MPLTLKQRLSDGTVVLVAEDGAQFVIRASQYERLQRLPAEQQREHAERMVIEARRDTSKDRSEADEEAMDFARDSSSGEAHQEAERRE